MRHLFGLTLALGAMCVAGPLAAQPAVPASGIPGFLVVPPTWRVAGQTQAYWAQQWWNWAENIRAAVNPNVQTPNAGDPSGGKHASIGNDGPVVFLPGSFGSTGAVSRTVTIPPGRPVVLPILTAEFVALPTTAPCPDPLTAACARGVLKPLIDGATGLSLSVDGLQLGQAIMRSYRQTGAVLADLWINPYPENYYVDSGNGTRDNFGYYPDRALQDGYWVVLDHLSVGRHRVRTTGTFAAPYQALRFDVTTILCVGVRTTAAGACPTQGLPKPGRP